MRPIREFLIIFPQGTHNLRPLGSAYPYLHRADVFPGSGCPGSGNNNPARAGKSIPTNFRGTLPKLPSMWQRAANERERSHSLHEWQVKGKINVGIHLLFGAPIKTSYCQQEQTMQIIPCPSPSSRKVETGFGKKYNEKRNAKSSMSSLLCKALGCLLFLSLPCFPCHPSADSSHPASARDLCPGDSPRDRLEHSLFELAMLIPALNSFELALLKPLAIEEMGGNIIEGAMWNGEGGGCSSAYHALGLGNCFWGNILMQHWQAVLEYCKSMSSSCECFSNMSILFHFVSSYCPILIKYCLSDGIPAANVL